jgi:hypothetical protein
VDVNLPEIRARLVFALEALEDGETALACDVLLDLRDELLSDGPRPPRRFRCSCGACFRWPGELDHHRLMSHGEAAA